MYLKIKGYTVKVTDCEGVSQKTIIDRARKIVDRMEKKARDAELGRTINTNVSFSTDRLKSAFEKKDMSAIEREIWFLQRDLMADASESHKNYTKTYRPETLKAVIAKYDKAISLLEKYGYDKFDLDRYLTLTSALHRVKENWDMTGETYLYEVFYKDGKSYGTYFSVYEDAKRKFDQDKENPAVKWSHIISQLTGEVLEDYTIKSDSMVDDRRPIRDIPYFEPTENPTITSTYSIERLKKEAAHPEKGQQNLDEFDEVIKEIDEFIEQGSDALVKAGWSKLDARHAINMKYYALVKELRKFGAVDQARQLKAKIRELEKAWDLAR